MFITTNDGCQLYTVSFGSSARTLVALGGWAGSWELWTEPFTDLSQTWRSVAYDHRGTGATLAAPESITFETLVEDVFTVLDALNIDQCVLAAESAGVLTALQAALRQPQRFQGLVLVDGLYYQPTPQQPDAFLLGLQTNFQATIEYFVDTCVVEPDTDAIRRWGRQILGRSSQAAAIRLYECVYGVDLRPFLAQITQPTLILHGADDRLVPVQAAEWLAAQIPISELQVFKATGHVPTVTRPREVAAAINQFFESLH